VTSPTDPDPKKQAIFSFAVKSITAIIWIGVLLALYLTVISDWLGIQHDLTSNEVGLFKAIFELIGELAKSAS
jgi:hypothetical protein